MNRYARFCSASSNPPQLIIPKHTNNCRGGIGLSGRSGRKKPFFARNFGRPVAAQKCPSCWPSWWHFSITSWNQCILYFRAAHFFACGPGAAAGNCCSGRNRHHQHDFSTFVVLRSSNRLGRRRCSLYGVLRPHHFLWGLVALGLLHLLLHGSLQYRGPSALFCGSLPRQCLSKIGHGTVIWG